MAQSVVRARAEREARDALGWRSNRRLKTVDSKFFPVDYEKDDLAVGNVLSHELYLTCVVERAYDQIRVGSRHKC